ncbi:MAG: MFS transporter [Armatimonadetes bacterium]|nr:MFS transporter [Armatimonadota bacterium]
MNPGRPRAPSWSRLGVLSFAHFTNDLYAAFLAPLLPLVVAKFSISLALAGLLGSAYNLSSAFSQPFFGMAADRVPRPVFTVLGALVTVVMMGLLGLAPSYHAMLAVLFIAGLGTAAFHPQSFSAAGAVSGDSRGAGISLFIAGGELGYSLGPVYVAAIVGAIGLAGTAVAALPGVVACLLLWRLAGSWWSDLETPTRVGLGSEVRRHGRALVLIWLVVVLRSVVTLGHVLFIPLLLRGRGETLMMGGTAVFLFGGVGSIGGLVGGALSDRIGRRAVMAISLIAAAPLLVLFGSIEGAWGLVPLALGGFMLFLAAPVSIVMAQEMFPSRASLASSMVTGMAWGTAGLSMTLIGAIADKIGLAQTLSASVGLFLIALVAIWALPAQPPRARTTLD